MGLLRAFRREANPQEKLRESLGEFNLPSFPEAALRCMRLLRDPESKLEAIAESLELDPRIHLRILRMVNSAGFGLRREVESVAHAVNMLGRTRVEALVVSAAVRDGIPPTNLSWFDDAEFWATSAHRATLARALSQEFDRASQAEALTLGLLQDIAVPIMARAMPDRYRTAWDYWRKDPTQTLHALEQASCNCDHADMGQLVATQWELPERLVAGIALHHLWPPETGPPEPGSIPAAGLVAPLRPGHDEAFLELLAVRLNQLGWKLDQGKLEELFWRSRTEAREFLGTMA